MTEFHVEVVRLGAVEHHPNADALDITRIHGGYPVIMRRGEYSEGDLAVYVPVDSVVPVADPRWSFLEGKSRIRAKKLRGVFSMGLLTQALSTWVEGQDVAEMMGITKYEPPAPGVQGAPHQHNYADDAEAPSGVPCYTDIEGLRRYGNILVPGEEVIITEKIHGENMRAFHDGVTLHVGSRTRWKKPGCGGWWRAAETAGLEARLAGTSLAWFGESHGYTGGYPYGTGRNATFRAFDAYDVSAGSFVDYGVFAATAAELGIDTAPVLYRGPWDAAKAYELAEGNSTMDPSHVREGIVVRPVFERWNERFGRVILKLHGEGFLLAQGKSK